MSRFTVQTAYRIPVDVDGDHARASAREPYDDPDPAQLATWTTGGHKRTAGGPCPACQHRPHHDPKDEPAMKNTTPPPPAAPACSTAGHLVGENLAGLLSTLAADGWRPEAAPAKSHPTRPVHAFTTPSRRIRLELAVYGDKAAPRHRLEITAAHPDNGSLLQPAWTLRAEDLPARVLGALANAAITGPTGQTPTSRLPRSGWSVLHVHEHDGRRLETRLTEPGGRRTVSFFPADPIINEPACWLIVRAGFDGAPCATTATASAPAHLVTALALAR